VRLLWATNAATTRSTQGVFTGDVPMKTESFEIVGSEAGWIVSHNGADGVPHATKEDAFEAAVAAASDAMKSGSDISIVVQGVRPHERALSGDWNALS